MEVFDTHRNSNWFVRLLRLLTLRRVDGLADMASDASVAACAAVALALWLVIDRLQWGAGVEFDSFGISMLALIAVLVLAISYVTARLSVPPQPVRCTLFIAVALLPLLIIAIALIDTLLAGRWSRRAWVILGVYVLLYALRSLRALSGRVPFWAVLAGAALLAGYFWLGQLMDLRPSLWAPPGNADEPDSSMSVPLAESLLFDQRARLDEALDAVADRSNTGGRPALLFVGFAGVPSQRVFAEEIKLAAHVVGERFGSASRELLLINDHRDFDSYPLAPVSGLRYEPGELAQKMNPERDILFLSLSSHGSDEPLLSVSNGVVPLQQG